jgi:hypothetical protein
MKGSVLVPDAVSNCAFHLYHIAIDKQALNTPNPTVRN